MTFFISWIELICFPVFLQLMSGAQVPSTQFNDSQHFLCSRKKQMKFTLPFLFIFFLWIMFPSLLTMTICVKSVCLFDDCPQLLVFTEGDPISFWSKDILFLHFWPFWWVFTYQDSAPTKVIFSSMSPQFTIFFHTH